MVKVENRRTLRLLTKKFMRMNRGRNRIAVLAIVLTALLFTSLFMGSRSMLLSRRATENEQSMCSSHAILQNMDSGRQEQILSALQKDADVARFGTGMFLGSGLDERYAFSVEIRCGDENLAQSFNSRPQHGRMPEGGNEIALSSLILDTFGIPHRLGETVTVTWENVPGETRTDDFTVCGYWEGDKAVLAQLAWVSEDYADEYAYCPTAEEIAGGTYNGSREYCVWFHTIWKLDEKTKKLSAEAGFEKGGGFEANTAYDMSYEDSFSYVPVAVFLVFIILAGYLIIYNIFHISVKTDIQAYGLLKNAGATGRQLKRIVRMQALELSAAGIPAGLLLGFLAGILMAPVLAQSEITTGAGQGNRVVTGESFPVFLLAGLFTLFTVYLSSLPACRMVSRISPVEALRLAQSDGTGRKLKKNVSATWFGMALQNMARNWKKGIIVMLSVSFSLVVVNCIAILVQGYDFDAFKKMFLEADFQLDKLKGMPNISDMSAVTPSMKQMLEDCPYSEETGYVYYSDERYAVDAPLEKVMLEDAETSGEDWNDWQKESWEYRMSEKEVGVHVMGLNRMAFDKLEWEENPLSWEDFKTGRYAVVYYVESSMYSPVFYLETGSPFSLEYENGTKKEYEVFGSASMPYALDCPFAEFMYLTVLVPEEEFIQCTENQCAMRAFLNADAGKAEELRQYLESTVLKEDRLLNVFSVLDMDESFGRYVGRYYMIGGLLAFILAFIGIMNFVNTVHASVFSRKRELALLEAVGMTKSQIAKMLVAEGCMYLSGSLLFAVVIVLCGAESLLEHTAGLTWYFHMHVTALPCLLFVPVLAAIAVAVPCCECRRMLRESVVERLRV